jgi:hypothetical protein
MLLLALAEGSRSLAWLACIQAQAGFDPERIWGDKITATDSASPGCVRQTGRPKLDQLREDDGLRVAMLHLEKSVATNEKLRRRNGSGLSTDLGFGFFFSESD